VPSGCVDAETAAGYVDHALAPAEAQAVEAHIDGCADCRELISALVRSQSTDGSDDPAPAVGGVLPPRTQVGPFEIEQPIDAGGMGLVYAAHDRRLDRRVALKGVREQRGRSDQLLREARMMAQLSHPNVVAVHDVIEAHDQIFLAMELVVGRSVRQWLDAAPRGWRAVTDVFLAAGAGLAAAHAAGIVHGDVKPANILVGDDGRVRVADFGLSAAADEAPRTAEPRGTPAYMAPEQRAGVACDAAGDQYAFCASLHDGLFGAPPGGKLRPARVPRGLRRIVARGLAADPAARFPSMARLLRALRATRSARGRWIAGAAVVALGLAVLAYGVGQRRVQTAMCEAAAPRLTSPWTAEARARLRDAFGRAKLAYAGETLARVEATLDRWTAGFEAARRGACERGWLEAEPPPARFAAHLGCLEDRAREARALINQLRKIDATIVSHAQAAADRLTPLATCDAPEPRPAAPVDSIARRILADRVAQVQAMADSGKFRDALPLAKANLATAEALGDPAMLAIARIKLGATQVGLSDYEAASPILMLALAAADVAQDDRTRAKAWVILMQSEYGRGHHEQVVFMKAPTLSATERIGDVWLQTEAMQFVGGALCELGRAGEAQPLFEEAVRLRRQMYGDRDRSLALALSSLGNGYAMQGNLAAGIAAHQQAVATAEAALGPGHPNVGVLHGNVGSDYLYGLQPARALPELTRALAIFEAANGPRQRVVAEALTDLGFALLEDGQRERAAATFARAMALWQDVNPKHPVRAMALLGNYQARAALGQPVAVADLELALSLGAQLPPFDRGRIQLALGLASPAPRARALIADALAGFGSSTLPLIARARAEAQAWQAAHGAAPDAPAAHGAHGAAPVAPAAHGATPDAPAAHGAHGAAPDAPAAHGAHGAAPDAPAAHGAGP
jgi:tetratricopeptide (TPR) repeat protein